MTRPGVFAIAVLLLFKSQSSAQVPADVINDYATAMAKAYAALERGDTEFARSALDDTDESVRGAAFKLLWHLATQQDPTQALTGIAAPKPDTRFALAVLHPTKPFAAYLCDGGVVLLYDLTQPKHAPTKIVSSRGKPLMNGTFSADGHFFAAGDGEGGIIVWDASSWKETSSYVKGTYPVRYVAVNKDGSKILAETEEGVVLWDKSRDQETGIVGKRYNFGTALCFSNDQRRCATGGLFSVLIHDVNTGKQIREIGHAPYTMHLCFSPDGQYIASGLRGSLNKWLGVFDVSTGETVFDRAKHDKGITGLVFLDNGKCLMSTSADGTIKFWHVPSGTELLTMRMGTSIYQPSINADGSSILWNQRSGPRYFLMK